MSNEVPYVEYLPEEEEFCSGQWDLCEEVACLAYVVPPPEPCGTCHEDVDFTEETTTLCAVCQRVLHGHCAKRVDDPTGIEVDLCHDCYVKFERKEILKQCGECQRYSVLTFETSEGTRCSECMCWEDSLPF